MTKQIIIQTPFSNMISKTIFIEMLKGLENISITLPIVYIRNVFQTGFHV